MERFFLSIAGILLLGSLGAFLLLVPLLSIASVILILVGLAAMFCLGFQVGRRRWPGARDVIHLHAAKILSLRVPGPRNASSIRAGF